MIFHPQNLALFEPSIISNDPRIIKNKNYFILVKDFRLFLLDMLSFTDLLGFVVFLYLGNDRCRSSRKNIQETVENFKRSFF